MSTEQATTFRPLGARIVAFVGAGCLTAILGVTWFALPDDITHRVTLTQRLTLLVFVAALLAILFAIARSCVRTDERGIHVVNGYRRHDLEWAEALSVTMGRGAPWAVLDTADGTSVSLMAIQGSDGDRARRAVRRLRTQIDAHGGTDPRA